MSGAGNDFIVVDNRDGSYSGLLTPGFVGGVCRRSLGVGADGLLELLPPRGSEAFRMGYYNSDGGRASMCGNGARCICCFARSLDIVKTGVEFTFTSDSGLHRGLVISADSSRIWMTEAETVFLGKPVDFGMTCPVNVVDTGVPHAVIFRDDLEDGTFEKFAGALRHHPETGRNGANADWARVRPDRSIELRTFERGVEGETLACGTGAVAAVIACIETGADITLPVDVHVRSGLVLTVGRDSFGWWLEGEARAVYRGVLVPPRGTEA